MSYYIPSYRIGPYSLPNGVTFTYTIPPKACQYFYPFGIIHTSRPLTLDECKAYAMKPLKIEASL